MTTFWETAVHLRTFRKLLSIYVFSYFPFGFEGRIWDMIVSVPDHCLSFYFTETSNFVAKMVTELYKSTVSETCGFHISRMFLFLNLSRTACC